MAEHPVIIERGFEEAERATLALIYDHAFGAKVGVAIPDPARRQAVVAASLDPAFGFVARQAGRVVGLAGFHTAQGSFTGGRTLRTLLDEVGLLGTVRAVVGFALLDRAPVASRLLMDGIAVAPEARGQGVGSRLLQHLIDWAREEGFEAVRLDVIDTNPRARQLYDRLGFQPVETQEFEVLRGVLGFGAATGMEYPLGQ